MLVNKGLRIVKYFDKLHCSKNKYMAPKAPFETVSGSRLRVFFLSNFFYYFLLLKMINNKGKNSSTVFEIILCRLGENFYQFPHFQNQTR